MIFIYILLIVAGALPLIVFLIKRSSYRQILREGTKTTAQVTEVRTNRFHKGGSYDRVYFVYLPAGASQYHTGTHIYNVGTYKRGDLFEIFYLPANPVKYAIPGSKGEIAFLIFTILLFFFVIFVCFKIHETVNAGNPAYQFKPPWTK